MKTTQVKNHTITVELNQEDVATAVLKYAKEKGAPNYSSAKFEGEGVQYKTQPAGKGKDKRHTVSAVVVLTNPIVPDAVQSKS